MQTEKYDTFFGEVKQIAIAAGLSTPDSFEGESKAEIESWFEQQNLTLEPCMLSFFKNFGRKKRIQYIDVPLVTTLKTIAEAQKRALDKSITKSIEAYHPQIREDYPFLDKIIPIFLSYNEVGGVLCFIISGIENSIVYLFWEGGEIEVETQNITFTTAIRSSFFWAIFHAISLNPFQVMPLKWMEFYRERYHFWLKIYNFLIDRRLEYSRLISQLEQQENRILGVSEYEEGFIAFLEERYVCFIHSRWG